MRFHRNINEEDEFEFLSLTRDVRSRQAILLILEDSFFIETDKVSAH